MQCCSSCALAAWFSSLIVDLSLDMILLLGAWTLESALSLLARLLLQQMFGSRSRTILAFWNLGHTQVHVRT
eukprot:scaffold56_cov146-Skeletonema_menzelii.AAC.6